MAKRFLGNIPIFGSDSKHGSIQDTTGYIIPKDTYDFYSNSVVGYERGLTSKVTPEVFNGAMNYLTQLIGYVYKKGVPEYSLNVAYDKGAIVTFEGRLYVSLTNQNIKHVSQTSHWGKFVIESNDSLHNEYGECILKTKDTNPVGTILTVPVTTEIDGYMDYIEGNTFNKTIYPELYAALGTDRFGLSTINYGNDLPVGSIVPLLSSSINIPDGYVEWNTSYGSLAKYPELVKVLTDMVNQLPLSDSKTAWTEALRTKSLPAFEHSGFFLGYGNQVGLYQTDTTRSQTLQFAPMVVDSSNTLNPLGYNRCAQQEQTVAPVNAQDVSQTHTESPYVILANQSGVFQSVANKQMYQVVVGDGTQTAPKQLAVRLLIKAVSSRPASISSTHKQIIKYKA